MTLTAKRSWMWLLAITITAATWTTGSAWAGDAKPAKDDKVDTYSLTTCPITGAKLGSMGDPVIKKYDGREVRFCCGGCPAKFEKDLPGNLKKLDAAVVKAQLASYPLTTCVVSGDKLGGDMGKPVDYVYKGQLVRLCCKSCIKDLEKNPQKYLAKINEARKAQKAQKADASQSDAAGEGHEHAMADNSGHEGHGATGEASGHSGGCCMH